MNREQKNFKNYEKQVPATFKLHADTEYFFKRTNLKILNFYI